MKECCKWRRASHVTRHTSHVTRHTSHVTRNTSPRLGGAARVKVDWGRLWMTRIDNHSGGNETGSQRSARHAQQSRRLKCASQDPTAAIGRRRVSQRCQRKATSTLLQTTMSLIPLVCLPDDVNECTYTSTTLVNGSAKVVACDHFLLQKYCFESHEADYYNC